MANPEKNSPVAEQVKDLLSSDITPVALNAPRSPWPRLTQPPESSRGRTPEGNAIIVMRLLIDLTTVATAACTVDVGTDGAGTGSSGNLIDGVDVNAATVSSIT